MTREGGTVTFQDDHLIVTTYIDVSDLRAEYARVYGSALTDDGMTQCTTLCVGDTHVHDDVEYVDGVSQRDPWNAPTAGTFDPHDGFPYPPS
jgi:hypothetical protein